MSKILKFSTFSKMVPKILIKFCRFIVHSKLNNMALSAFPGKIPETGKIFFKFFPSPNAGPKPTHQSRSKSISRVLSHISRTLFLVFSLPLKLRVVHMRKKLKILIFSKMAITILVNFCRFIVHSKLNNMAPSAFPEKILVTRIIFFNFLSVA